MEIITPRPVHVQDCDSSYCEYVNVQNSMMSGPPCSVTGESELSPQFTQKHSLIFEQNYQFMWILRLFGSCPLILPNPDQKAKGQTLPVTFRWKSKVVFWSGILGILRIGLTGLFYLDWGEVMLGRKYENTFDDYCLLFINIILPLAKIWEVVTVWLTARNTERVINAWILFEAEFQSTFGPGYSYACNTKRWRHIFFLFSIIPFIQTFLSVFSVIFFYEWAMIPFSKSRLLLNTTGAFWIMILTVSKDCKCSLACFTAQEAFDNLSKGIAFQLNNFDHLSQRQVSHWTELLHLIRMNVELIGKTEAPYQLFVAFETVVIFTEVLFLASRIAGGAELKPHFFVILFIGVGYFHRLLCKIVAAERLSQQEQEIGNFLLSGAKAEKFDLDGKMELQKMLGVIHQKPCKVSLNGYVILEKRMILTILNCVMTYLVVLIQMNIGYEFEEKNQKNDTSS